jgi:hypothetical protein
MHYDSLVISLWWFVFPKKGLLTHWHSSVPPQLLWQVPVSPAEKLVVNQILRPRCVDQVAKKLHQAGKIKDECEDVDFYHRLTALEAQFPNASVLVHKQGILPPEIADLWGCKKLMSAARQLLGGNRPHGCLV